MLVVLSFCFQPKPSPSPPPWTRPARPSQLTAACCWRTPRTVLAPSFIREHHQSRRDCGFHDVKLEGDYILQVEPGFYLIKWEKYGYLPQELGDFTLNSDTTLNQVMMQPGFVQEVCGEVSGTWSSGFVYHVTCDIVVPDGETLTIEEGVTVRFAEGVGMTCNGTLVAEGTEEDRILLTTLSPTPLPGDWDNVELYGSSNLISYVDYEYATDGFTGDFAGNSTFDHIRISSGLMSLDADGINLANSSNMTFTNNEIGVAGDYCIRCSNCDFSEFTGNSTSGAEYGIRANDSYYLTIENNVIENFKRAWDLFPEFTLFEGELQPFVGAEAGGWKRGIHNTEAINMQRLTTTTLNFQSKGGNNVDQWGIEVHDSEVLAIRSWFRSILVVVMVEFDSGRPF